MPPPTGVVSGPLMPTRYVRIDVQHFTARVQLLHPMPEAHGQQLAVVRQEDVEQRTGEPEESPELLGEDIALAHVERRLRRPLVEVVTRRGQLAEPAVGE